MPYKNDSDKPIYLNADKSKVVEEGADAAFLLVGPGGEVPDAEAAKYGLVTDDQAKATGGAKAQQPAQDKAVKAAPENKAK